MSYPQLCTFGYWYQYFLGRGCTTYAISQEHNKHTTFLFLAYTRVPFLCYNCTMFIYNTKSNALVLIVDMRGIITGGVLQYAGASIIITCTYRSVVTVWVHYVLNFFYVPFCFCYVHYILRLLGKVLVSYGYHRISTVCYAVHTFLYVL